jgi:hypothetical protein
MSENDNKVVSYFTKSLKRHAIFKTKESISVQELVIMVFKGMKKPIVAAKAAFLRNTALQASIRQIPWIPIGLIVLAGTVLLYKDLNFNINLSAPTGGGGSGVAGGSSVVPQPISNPNSDVLFSGVQDQKNRSYIRAYSELAMNYHRAYGVPASILLAQALIDSNAGENVAATLNNNHFAIQCHSKNCRKGHCSSLDKGEHKAFYRKYKSVDDSWRAHSLMITTGKYRELTNSKDYQYWANSLQQLSFNDADEYAKKLIRLIQNYKLGVLDK